LYSFCDADYNGAYFNDNFLNGQPLTKKQKDKVVKDFTDGFELALKKGTLFVCYHYGDENLWHDDVDYGIEDMDDNWANEHLINIQKKD
jgi:hypothetical protein